MIGGLGDDRPYSYALAKDCILNFDRLYNSDAQSANDRKEKSGKFIIQKAFAYIKLYEQSPYVQDFLQVLLHLLMIGLEPFGEIIYRTFSQLIK